MYYISSENKGADQLHDYCPVNLYLFAHIQKASFATTWLICTRMKTFHRIWISTDKEQIIYKIIRAWSQENISLVVPIKALKNKGTDQPVCTLAQLSRGGGGGGEGGVCIYSKGRFTYKAFLTRRVPNTTIAEFANTVDPDEMPIMSHYEPSHLDLQCLPSSY